MRPDEERRQLFGFHLAWAQASFPGILLHAVVQMSNHLHLVLTDSHGQLADFMCRFLGPLAKSINALDGVRGPLFERRYSPIRIVDDEALIQQIAYTVTNPIAAGLVQTVEDWPGVVVWEPGHAEVFSRLRWREYERAVRRFGDDANVEDFTDSRRVRITPVELNGGPSADEVEVAIKARVEVLVEERSGKPVVGVDAVLLANPFDRPERPKRSPMPVCHASTFERWASFLTDLKALVAGYRRASALFRAGALDVVFPAHTFRPWSYG